MKTQRRKRCPNERRLLLVGLFVRLLPMLLSLVTTAAAAAVFAPPAEASPVTPVPEQPLLAEQTPYEACLARGAPDPEVCKGVPNSTPSSGGSQEDSPQYSPGGPTPRQMAAAKAAVQEAVKDRGGAVDGATAYAAALAAARRAGADEQGASVAAAQAVAELSPSSYGVPKDEPANTAGSPSSEVPSAGGESPSAEQTTSSVAGGEASTRASPEAPAQVSSAGGGATAPTVAAAEDGSGSLKASVGSLGSASPLVLGAAGLLLLLAAAGLGGFLIRRGRRVS